MRKAAIPALIVVIFLVFGIILAAVVIYWAMSKFTEFVQGQCWANMGKTIDSLSSQLSSAGSDANSAQLQKMTIGDCAGGIIIFNKDAAPASGFSQVIEDRCVKADSVKSYILVIPWKTFSEEAKKDEGVTGKIYRWLTSPVMSFKDAWEWGRQKTLFMKPICKSLDVSIDSYYCIPQGICGNPADLSQLTEKMLNEKTITYCYKPLKLEMVSGNNKVNAYSLRDLAECTK